MNYRKKIIEVSLPLSAINDACIREKAIRHGHPSTLHIWWARRPLAAARAVIFAQFIDDPSSWPEIFPTEKEQTVERKRLFGIIEELVKWENINNLPLLQAARDEIKKSWIRTCEDNSGNPNVAQLFNPHQLPDFHDPFAGGGGIPLEAQRLGLESWATDLNPVAVLINKAMTEIPPKFIDSLPVNPEVNSDGELFKKEWTGLQGLAEDIKYYGMWLKAECEKKIGHLYPKIEVTQDYIDSHSGCLEKVGEQLNVVAWLWARTVESPNPAFSGIHVPLVSSFILSNKPGKENWIDPIITNNGYEFIVKPGVPKEINRYESGTKMNGSANFRCIMSGSPISAEYIRNEGMNGRIGCRLLAIVAEGKKGRAYFSPNAIHENAASAADPIWKPDVEFFKHALGFRVGNYGITNWSELFTKRQLTLLSTLASLIPELILQIKSDAAKNSKANVDGGDYAKAVALYVSLSISKTANRASTLCTFKTGVECPGDTFGRHALPFTWDFAEANSLNGPSGSFQSMLQNTIAGLMSISANIRTKGHAFQADAQSQIVSKNKVVSTDPPYYDNIGYADLSDFFYVWLRKSLRDIFEEIFETVSVPKTEELVATPIRNGTKKQAEDFFLGGMTKAISSIANNSHPAFPVTIYYAFKQIETDAGSGTASTGWETFIDAIIASGFAICGTWPIQTERGNRKRNQDANALASSIVLVCRKRSNDAAIVTRREFLNALKTELPAAFGKLQAGNIAPVDLAQAAIGPGMSVFTRYSKVIDAEGKAISVRDALKLINETLDEVLSEQEGDFDSDTRWAISWFDQFAFNNGPYGVAEQLSVAKVTSVQGLADADIVASKAGVVRLLRPAELPANWDPTTDRRLTAWEIVHHLVRALESGGESAAASLVVKLGSKAETARELAYRLYNLCERRKRASEALSYNALVQSWPEILRQGNDNRSSKPSQGTLFNASDAEG